MALKLPNFGQATTASIAVLVMINAWLCYNGKRLEAENQATKTEIALVNADNRNLAEQIKAANVSIEHYRQQVKALHENVLKRMQQAEERTNEIMQELEKYSHWADDVVPDDISRLLNRRKDPLPNHSEDNTALPDGKPMPDAGVKNQNK